MQYTLRVTKYIFISGAHVPFFVLLYTYIYDPFVLLKKLCIIVNVILFLCWSYKENKSCIYFYSLCSIDASIDLFQLGSVVIDVLTSLISVTLLIFRKTYKKQWRVRFKSFSITFWRLVGTNFTYISIVRNIFYIIINDEHLYVPMIKKIASISRK